MKKSQRPETYRHRTPDGRIVRVTVPGNEDQRALEELCEAATDARLVLMMAGGTSKAAIAERARSIARLEAALRGLGINI
jgi:riboflavin synthase